MTKLEAGLVACTVWRNPYPAWLSHWSASSL